MVIAGELARRFYESVRRQAACLRIQTFLRMYIARKAYNELVSSSIIIQTGMRAMAARKELHFRRQTRAAILIQVYLIRDDSYFRRSALSPIPLLVLHSLLFIQVRHP